MTLKTEHLKKKYASFELDIQNLQIEDGEIFGLVGNNGAGKTTFLRLVLDLIKADCGKILLGDINIAKSDDWKKYTGSFLDEGFLIDFLTPEEYFEFVAFLYNMSKEQLQNSLIRFETFFNGKILSQNKYIREMSTGNKQKIGIAAATLMDPDVLILDEPFANLDPTSRKSLINLLIDLNNKKKTTMIISSHDLTNISHICTKIAILENGKIIKNIKVLAESYNKLNEYFKLREK